MPALTLLFEHAPRVERLAARLDALDVEVFAVDVREAIACRGLPGVARGLVVNRVGAHPVSGGDPAVVLGARELLRRLEGAGRSVVNGYRSYAVATSKIAQSRVILGLGLRTPRTVPVSGPSALPSAAGRLTFPILFKPNVGGSGAGIRVLRGAADVEAAVGDPTLTLGADGTGIVQEYHTPADGTIVRVELLGDRPLYAARQRVIDGVFNYCAAEGCHADDGAIEIVELDPAAGAEAARILVAGASDFGAVEYLLSARDGGRYWFDINPFSNYVRPDVLGFDPTERLAEFLLSRA